MGGERHVPSRGETFAASDAGRSGSFGRHGFRSGSVSRKKERRLEIAAICLLLSWLFGVPPGISEFSALAAPRQEPSPAGAAQGDPLPDLLARTAAYCENIKAIALYYVFQEKIEVDGAENINSSRSASRSNTGLEPVAQEAVPGGQCPSPIWKAFLFNCQGRDVLRYPAAGIEAGASFWATCSGA